MRIAAVAGLICALAANVPAQNTVQKKPPASTGRASKGAKSSSAHKAAAKSGTKASAAHPKSPASAHSKASTQHGKTATKRGKKGSKAAWRSRQLSPTPDRYKDIQSALATRGYLQQTPTGVWDATSADALRRFQQDQNLEPSGKLNSLSLIALGLGAKRGPPVVPASAKPAVITPQAPRVQSPETPSSPGAIPSAPVPNPSVTEPRVPDSTSPAPTNSAPPSPNQPNPAPPNTEPFS